MKSKKQHKPKTLDSGVVLLEKIPTPYRPLRPFFLPNKPQLIDPMVIPPQVCVMAAGQVIAQCNAPADENDFTSWQQVIKFFRDAVSMIKPERPLLCFIEKGEIIGDMMNAPNIAGDMHAWQDAMIHLRVIVGARRQKKI